MFLCLPAHAEGPRNAYSATDTSIAIRGTIRDKQTAEPLAGAVIAYGSRKALADRNGRFTITLTAATDSLIFSMTGYKGDTLAPAQLTTNLSILLQPTAGLLQDVVVTGTMKAVLKTASPVPVEVYTPQFFRKNPTPTIFDALQLVNGVRPQLNCNICNTGDIHINGLEGPYTMVLIDGMPIVSSLGSVYGLSGIPNSLVERIEVVKGPASSLYGSEAIGGLINVITKNPLKAPQLALDLSTTTWNEVNADVAVKFRPFEKTTSLLGVNYFNFSNRVDKNNDNFTDVTLQHRIAFFNKYSWERKDNRQANFAARYVYEDRWGGDMRWTKEFRGGDSLYGESIYTSRLELIGNYQLPVHEKILFSWSYNNHVQRSAYGDMLFNARQQVGFGQLTWDKTLGRHDLLAGAVLRHTWYDDNTTATLDTLTQANAPSRATLPGVLLQDEFSLTGSSKLLAGIRWDHHPVHGHIFTPRIAWKLSVNSNDVLRLNAGTGFRVVNIFTEDHAALTGARDVEILSELKPERSYNVNLNYVKKIYTRAAWVNLDASTWYTHFTNRIIPDYMTDPNKIIYDNLAGYSLSYGASLNTEFGFTNGLRGHVGFTFQQVSLVDRDGQGKRREQRQLLTEKWSGNWSLSYALPWGGFSVDYTGNIYGPMLLPLLSDRDPRPGQSPIWSIQNIQVTKKLGSGVELYGGIKNLLNWTPAKNVPFLIARANDPFDKDAASDPYGLTFDPNYVYAPNQGMRGFAGIRWTLAP
ncbi:MAG: TonB-dependent receptor [Candidatus Pseudobacter hemicellulosilyticus]|uniref:TonB-dependent receptor n=1 Tax=Candidatus Pseudobacter hemicellulosilyticus TaxID=3121375 RepID=A0AAJ5WKV5_9BACT|nr:MAG: TonB-dependent receptor [Pseudobacter sp.]